jgi:hypothetical protein
LVLCTRKNLATVQLTTGRVVKHRLKTFQFEFHSQTLYDIEKLGMYDTFQALEKIHH